MPARGPDLRPGDVLPGTKYRVVRQLGVGGMGVVYQVVKPPEIHCVLKLMSTELTEHEEFRSRFLDEVHVLAQLDHPNIVRVFDYDTLTDGTPFYVMELLNGQTVRDVLATMRTIPPRVAFEITRQLLEALHCAHTHDVTVVHRDIKPENIFLHAPRHGEPVVKLIDFGVVALSNRQHENTFVGTWSYAAPEQIRGERATAATDLYAVGLVLYEMLAGAGPFDHYDTGTLISRAHLNETPAPVSKAAPWVPPSVVELIASALSKDPRQRPRDAYAFAERLFELEWASDGKDPHDRTSEGPLRRVMSTHGPPAATAAPMPVMAVRAEHRHQGPTIKGVGNEVNATSPGEDLLLAGLSARHAATAAERSPRGSHRLPPAAGVLEPGVPASGRGSSFGTQDGRSFGAVPSPSFPRGDVSRSDGGRSADRPTAETDTFASQESDAPRPAASRRLAVPFAIGAIVAAGALGFGALRARTAGPDVVPASPAVNAVSAPASVMTLGHPAVSSAVVATTATVLMASPVSLPDAGAGASASGPLTAPGASASHAPASGTKPGSTMPRANVAAETTTPSKPPAAARTTSSPSAPPTTVTPNAPLNNGYAREL